jgi:hypothetical protein
MMAITLMSLVIHLILILRIKIFKFQQRKLVFVISSFEHLKNLAISSIDSQALSDLGTSVVNLLLVGFSHLFSNRINSMSPERANEYPFYLLLYAYYFFANNLITGFLSLTYYARHPPLRKAICREIKSKFGFWPFK